MRIKKILESKWKYSTYDYYIIFKDGDRDNIKIENLEEIHRDKAIKLYNFANQHGYKKYPDKAIFGKNKLLII